MVVEVKKEDGKQRFALTFLVTVCVFVVMLITSVISCGVVYLFVSTDSFPLKIGDEITPQYALFSMLAVSLIIGIVLSAVMSHIMVKHVNRLIDQMNHLASGDFKTRLHYGEPICNHPTVREITESFNQMADELEHTEMLRGDFVNNFSHEFKTPIVSIAGFAKLLKKGNLTEEQKAEYLDIIEEESLRLSEMATNVLNMTKIENQTILTDVAAYNLSEQIRSCVLLLEKRWTAKNLELSLEFDEHDICACEELLKQVWINLLDNAIKYSPEYGLIVVKIREEGQSYHISIANSGEEIPEEKRQKIFEKFYQADESHSSPGNGIGLSIVKSVVDLHGGRVSVECRNGITTFHVWLVQDVGSSFSRFANA
jgi:signal transduction histidine kinase